MARDDGSVLKPDLCVIGAGAAGLSVAVPAAAMGVPVVLVEMGRMGGDCLNVGCVPSKALLAAAARAHLARHAGAVGVSTGPVVVDPAAVAAHVRAVIESISPTDAEARMRSLGMQVIRAQARFVDDRELEAGGRRIRARRFVVATGSRPALPPIPGLDGLPVLTNESVFGLEVRPRHLLVIGGGPIGLELAQAHRRLGAAVTVIEAGPRILAREDGEAAALLAACLEREGVRLIEGAKVARAERRGEALALVVEGPGGEEVLEGSHVLVAAGRLPVTDTLDLEKAGVRTGRAGIEVDAHLRSSNRRIYAVGDVAGGPQLTHAASQQASIVLRNLLFRLPARFEPGLIPRAVYTEPELAAVGLAEQEAMQRKGARILRFPLAENDRARAERLGPGFIKVFVDGRRRILGAVVVAPQAGDLIAPWCLALAKGLRISDMAGLVVPYPTLSELSKRVGVQAYSEDLRRPWLKTLLATLRIFG